MEKNPCVYIVTNKRNGTLYIGVTTNLPLRILQHKQGAIEGFTRKYALKRLVYFEQADSIIVAIEREKQLKNWPREWKIRLIEALNPEWDDLYESIL
jgi:putative endonuclease